MTHKVYVVTDLGPGDGGKGGVVHKVATMTRARTITKVGGAQGSHGVRTSKGEKFNFSQWGCGTLEGIPTHLSDQMVIHPEGILNEATLLRYQHWIHNPFDLLTADENALCATSYHGIASRLKELARKRPRGTIGTGVGEAYRELRRNPELAIFARDLSNGPRLREQLGAVRSYMQSSLKPIIEGDLFAREDQSLVGEEVRWLFSDEFFEHTVKQFQEAGRLLRVVGHDYFGEVILAQEGVVVVETSHGVLTDREYGFHPHTSAIRTLPRFRHQMLEEAGFDGQAVNLGVTRAYGIRHGAGPMPTANPADGERLLPGSNKDENRWQGKVRVGPLDTVLLRYAVNACGGPGAFDGLAITWFDQIQANQAWEVCQRYDNGADDPMYFSPNGDILVTDQPTLARQNGLGQALESCHPAVTTIPIDASASQDELFSLVSDVMTREVAVPVRMVSFGPTEVDKLCK